MALQLSVSYLIIILFIFWSDLLLPAIREQWIYSVYDAAILEDVLLVQSIITNY